MERRDFIGFATASVTVAVAGCIDSDLTNNETGANSFNIELEFGYGGALIAFLSDGDVLEGGEEVYMTISGDVVAETTLDRDVHSGGEIIRSEGVMEEYSDTLSVGVYLDSDEGSVELTSEDVEVPEPYSPPNSQIGFNFVESEGELIVTHEGGQSITGENTGALFFTRDVSGVRGFSWRDSLDERGDARAVAEDELSLTGGEEIVTVDVSDGATELHINWEAPTGAETATLGSWIRP